jgi:diguanylate cyclase (GGDEF)-like protein
MSQRLEQGARILIIDDSPTLRGEVIKVLQSTGLFSGFVEAESPTEGFKILVEKNNIDIILCDVVMPGMDGFKFLAMKMARPEFSDIPVIMLTSQGEVKNKIKGLEEGASDYLTKPFDPGELIARVKAHLRIKMLQDALKKTNEQLIELSIRDVLTGLFNRRHFMEILEKEFDRTQRYGSKLAFLMMDLDHFKSINDTYGHITGDKVLVEVSKIFLKGLRKNDVVGRYGGEEFAMILPGSDKLGAQIVAERYRKAVERINYNQESQTIKLTVTIGCSYAPHPEIKNINDLINRADDALYRGKKLGRNRTELMYESKETMGI